MKLLDLFSGTGSIGSVAKELGYEVISLDKDMDADIKCNILDWNYKIYPPKYFDFIHCSPPCTEYSIAKTTAIRDIEGANKVVQKTLEILDYFQPTYWTLENPQTGYLKKQEFMINLPFKDIDYCKYGMPYRKRTRIWTNLESWNPRPLCKRDCCSMDDTGRKHISVAQRGPNSSYPKNAFVQGELYRIPKELVNEILSSV